MISREAFCGNSGAATAAAAYPAWRRSGGGLSGVAARRIGVIAAAAARRIGVIAAATKEFSLSA